MKKILLLKLIVLSILTIFSTRVNGQALFQEVTGTGLPALGRSCAAWGDYNNDGFLDLLVIGESASGNIAKIYRNNNGDGSFTDAVTLLPNGLKTGYVAWGDYDNDGNIDALICGDGGTGVGIVTKLFKNNANGTFTENKSIAFPGNYAGQVTFIDYNNDGFLDIHIIGRNNTVHGRSNSNRLYRNNKNGTFSEVGGTKVSAGSNNSYQYSTDLFLYPGYNDVSWGPESGSDAMGSWADFTNDGFLDLICMGYPDSRLPNFLSNGKGGFKPVSGTTGNGLPVIQYNGAVTYGDFDNDGDLDVAFAGTGKKIMVYKNSGAPNYSFSWWQDLMAINVTNLIPNSISWGDYDNDGDLDLLIEYQDATASSTIVGAKIYRNNGYTAPQATAFTELSATEFPAVTGARLGSAIWGDYNGDGLLDVLVTGADNTVNTTAGQVRLYKNISGAAANIAPTAPTTLSSTIGSSDVVLTWNNASDPQQGAFVNFTLRVGTTPGGSDIVNPLIRTSDGKRKLPASGKIQQSVTTPGTADAVTNYPLKNLSPGTYYWSVQAIDNSYTGSTWSAEQQFTITAKQASNIKFSSISPGNITISWKRGNNGNTAVFIDTFNIYRVGYGAASPSDKKTDFPQLVDDTLFVSNSTFGTTTTKFRKTGWYCVYNGTDTFVTVSGISRTDILRYSVAVIDYSGSAGSEKYNLNMTTGNPQIIPPTINSRNIITSNITSAGVTATWNNAFLNQTVSGNTNYLNSIQGFGRAVFIKEGARAQNLNIPIENDTIYQANTAFGSGKQIRNSGWYCVYNGYSNPATSSVSVTGLKGLTNYTIRVVEYFNIPGPIKYLPLDTVSNPIEFITADYTAPTKQATNVLISNVTSTKFDVKCNKGNGSQRAMFIYKGTSGTMAAVNNITYTANAAFGLGTQVGTTGWYCIYNGTDSIVTVTGINSVNSYVVKVCEYNGRPGLEKYITSDTINNPGALINNRADQTITMATNTAKTFGNANFDLAAAASSGLPVSYSSSDATIATIVSGLVHIVGAGKCIITALQSGDINYNPAPPASDTLVVSKAASTITFDPLPNKTMIDAPFTVSATASSGLPVTFANSTPLVATISGSTVTIVGMGTDTITATQTGDNNYLSAPPVKQTFAVTKVTQTITFGALPTLKNSDPNYKLEATASSGLKVIFRSNDLTVAAVQGDVTGDYIHLFGAGTCIITASQTGNSIYLPATSVPQTLTVTSTTDVRQLATDEVLAYPNPATDKITLTFGSSLLNATIGIYSLTGQQMSMAKVDNSVVDINVSDLKPGIYTIKIINADGITVKQIVKQ